MPQAGCAWRVGGRKAVGPLHANQTKLHASLEGAKRCCRSGSAFWGCAGARSSPCYGDARVQVVDLGGAQGHCLQVLLHLRVGAGRAGRGEALPRHRAGRQALELRCNDRRAGRQAGRCALNGCTRPQEELLFEGGQAGGAGTAGAAGLEARTGGRAGRHPPPWPGCASAPAAPASCPACWPGSPPSTPCRPCPPCPPWPASAPAPAPAAARGKCMGNDRQVSGAGDRGATGEQGKGMGEGREVSRAGERGACAAQGRE